MLARFVNSLPTGISQQLTRLYFQGNYFVCIFLPSDFENHLYDTGFEEENEILSFIKIYFSKIKII